MSILDDFSPVGWGEVATVLGVVAKGVGRNAVRHLGRERPLDGWIMALTVPHWANELAGGKLSRKVLRDLQIAQAHLLCFFNVYDPLLDDGPPRAAGAAEMVPLLAGFHLRLAGLFEAGHPFWRDYRRLVRHQLESDRWEIAARDRPAPAFDAALVRALGRKLSLLRWPASAVALLSGEPEATRRLDAIFDRFFRVLQLLDDVTDVEQDRASGQTNAALCAATALAGAQRPKLAVALGIARACGAARAELARIQGQLSGPAGRFARLCAYLDESCRHGEESALTVASYAVAADALGKVVAALA